MPDNLFDIIETHKKDIFAIGDVHGEFKAISTWIKQYQLKDCVIIFCGDFGLGFDKINKTRSELCKANKLCENNDIDCYIIRGNHDDPSYYNQQPSELNLSRFKPLKDYTVIKSPEHNILCLGGAVSTDRSYRIKAYEEQLLKLTSQKGRVPYRKQKAEIKCYWWKDEPFQYNETILNEIIHSNISINTICSHAAPTECYPITSGRVQYWCELDKTLEHDLKQERESLSMVLNKLKGTMPIKNWVYGHYHEHNTDIIDNVKFTLLDMGRNGRFSSGPGGVFDMTQIN